METHPNFVERYRNARDFLLVNRLDDSAPMRHERAGLALAIMLGMVASATFGWLSLIEAAMLAAGLMLITRCTSAAAARRAVDLQVLLVIAAAFGISLALQKSRAAAAVARLEVSLLPFAIAIMKAASASFATPIGYQTNLMVMGPGGYRFGDYLRLGVPITLLTGALTVLIVPWVWPFQ